MRDRWSAQLAAVVVFLMLSGCNVLMFPIVIIMWIVTVVVGLFTAAAPGIAGAALVQADPAPDPALRRLETQLVQRLEATEREHAPLPTPGPAELARLVRERQARSVALVDVSKLPEAEARRWLERLSAAGGELLLIDGGALADAGARQRLAAELGDVALIER